VEFFICPFIGYILCDISEVGFNCLIEALIEIHYLDYQFYPAAFAKI
jgi:phosphoribosylaminoimidazole-succinocarboxamide synthase